MAIMSSVLDAKGCLTVSIKGRFDFHSAGKFRYHYQKQNEQIDKFVIDLSETQTVDSTAIGLLLQLKDAVATSDIVLKGPNDEVRRIFEIVQLDRLFTIE